MKNTFILLVLATICSQTYAQDADMKFTFDHYAVNVNDLNSSVAFYQKYFFVEEIYDGTEKDHIRWFSLGNNQELHIIEVKDLDLKIPKGVHMALSTADLDKYIKYLKKTKTEYFDWPGASMQVSTRPDKVRQVYIVDPDGYWIEINDGETRYTKK